MDSVLSRAMAGRAESQQVHERKVLTLIGLENFWKIDLRATVSDCSKPQATPGDSSV
jgi:hypothetical protein